MASTDELKLKIKTLEKALLTLEESLQIDVYKFNQIELDTLKNGQIQKFEYCIELCWKTIKTFLNEFHGIDPVSPKATMKALYKTRYINDEIYEALIYMINDRNRLSHIYEEKYFNEIYSKLPHYLSTMKIVLSEIKQE